MSFFELPDWSTALLTLSDAAIQGRGFVALDDEEHLIPDHPRTTGEDVITIAALIDRLVREYLDADGDAIASWIVTADELARDALMQPTREYANNRTFWRTLEQVCVELDQRGADLAQLALWNPLVEHLASPIQYRNVGPKGDGPFKHFDGVKTFDDLYSAQAKHLRELRGFDKMDPEPGGAGGVRSIPRSTNAEVIQLADYWTKQFAVARRIDEYDEVKERWERAVADVSAIARKGNPDAVYPKNNAFWRALQKAAIYIALADESPTSWDIAVDALKDSVKALPATISGGGAAAVEAAADFAKGAGRVVRDAATGALGGLAKPLLIGAGVIGGLVLLTRSGKGS